MKVGKNIHPMTRNSKALNHWRHYLMGNEFVLFSDNSALQYVMQ